MKVIKQTELHYNSGSSDKVYNVEMIDHGPDESYRYEIVARYGRRGSHLNEVPKGKCTSFITAERKFINLISSKIAKGYYELNSWSTKEGRRHSVNYYDY